MGEDIGRQLYAHADIDPVGFGMDAQGITDALHPFAAASSDGDDTLFAGGSLILAVVQGVHGIVIFDRSYRSQEEEIHLLFQFVVQIFQNDIVDIRSQMTDGSIQQLQLVLDAQLFEFGSGCGVPPKSLVILYFPSENAPAPPKPLMIAQVLQPIQVFTFSPSMGQWRLLNGLPASNTAIFNPGFF